MLLEFKFEILRFFTGVLFLIGATGFYSGRQNLIVVLMSAEILLLAINLNFIFTSAYLDEILGIIFALIILTAAGAEAAVGLSILIVYYRIKGIISVNFVKTLKG